MNDVPRAPWARSSTARPSSLSGTTATTKRTRAAFEGRLVHSGDLATVDDEGTSPSSIARRT